MTFMIITYAYLFTRKEGLGVMLARNGSGVLRVMISSAASKRTRSTLRRSHAAFHGSLRTTGVTLSPLQISSKKFCSNQAHSW